MKIGPLLAHLDELEAAYAEALRDAADAVRGGARRLPPVPHVRRCGRPATARSCAPLRQRYAGKRRVADASPAGPERCSWRSSGRSTCWRTRWR